MTSKYLLTIMAFLLVTGCAISIKKFDNVNPGSDRADVIKYLGAPNSREAHGNREILYYEVDDGGFLVSNYAVYIENDKVLGFNKVGQDPYLRTMQIQNASQSLQNLGNSLSSQQPVQSLQQPSSLSFNPTRQCITHPDGFGNLTTQCF